MHRIYTSLAIIIDSRHQAEADRWITFYTREYGLVSASVKSVRLEKSKLRYSLGLFSVSEVSMVRGRDVWRVTSAAHEKTYVGNITSIKKTFSILKRFSGEEVPDRHLFDSLETYLQYVGTERTVVLLKEAEIGIALHILNRLGYIPSVPTLNDFLAIPFSSDRLLELSDDLIKAVPLINQAITHAHL
jgi:DNA repair protein RecO